MITIMQFNNLTKVMKAMKCDRFLILPNMIIGCDNDIITITTAMLDTGIDNTYYELNKEIFKDLQDSVKEFSTNKSKEDLSRIDIEPYIRYVSIKSVRDNLIYNSYARIKNEISTEYYPFSDIVNAKDDEIFNECISLKSKDGLGKFFVKDVMLSIFTGLLPINKNDKVSLTMYRQPMSDIGYNIYICLFSINKGFTTLNKYIKYIF